MKWYRLWIGLLVLTSWAQAAHGSEILQLKRLKTWQGGGTLEARALELWESSDLESARLHLLETPAGRRVTLRQTILAPEGLTVWQIQDDATGWWLELRQDIGLKFVSIWEYGWTGFYRRATTPPSEWKLCLTTRGGLAFETTLTLEEYIVPGFAAILAKLRRAGLAEALAAEIPGELGEPAAFLASLESGLSQPGAATEFTDIGRLLMLALATTGKAPAQPLYSQLGWQISRSRANKGTAGLNGEYRAFAKRFGSVDARAPLAGFHVDPGEGKLCRAAVSAEDGIGKAPVCGPGPCGSSTAASPARWRRLRGEGLPASLEPQ